MHQMKLMAMSPELICDEISYRLYDIECGKFIANIAVLPIVDCYTVSYNRTQINVKNICQNVFNIQSDFDIVVYLYSDLLISFHIDCVNKCCTIHNLQYVMDNKIKILTFLSILESKRKELFYGTNINEI